ncbi:hypothetical protein [uncultured Algimonas sp.]|uniref:hypothetical protein n=1 Tax=uncultured Algimonas sp. TaxID=1547920 RepID=UPI002630F1CB|nr:hypothetical protein [uncultured Algimonas sp.]
MEIIPFDRAVNRDFRPLYEGYPERPHLHTLDGDPDRGPSLTLFRYSRNYGGNLHYHTHSYRLWLIEGEMKHWDANGSEARAALLRPGAYIYQPANQAHAANCLTERCTAYVLFDGPIETGPAGDH